MKVEKHREALKEVLDTIEDALEDPKGLIAHQRRLMAMLSLGMAHLIELYLHGLGVIKPGTLIKHDWFKRDERKISLRLAAVLTKSLGKIEKINEILYLAKEIEKGRDEIVYGTPLPSEKVLKEKIDLWLELKKVVGEK